MSLLLLFRTPAQAGGSANIAVVCTVSAPAPVTATVPSAAVAAVATVSLPAGDTVLTTDAIAAAVAVGTTQSVTDVQSNPVAIAASSSIFPVLVIVPNVTVSAVVTIFAVPFLGTLGDAELSFTSQLLGTLTEVDFTVEYDCVADVESVGYWPRPPGWTWDTGKQRRIYVYANALMDMRFAAQAVGESRPPRPPEWKLRRGVWIRIHPYVETVGTVETILYTPRVLARVSAEAEVSTGLELGVSASVVSAGQVWYVGQGQSASLASSGFALAQPSVEPFAAKQIARTVESGVALEVRALARVESRVVSCAAVAAVAHAQGSGVAAALVTLQTITVQMQASGEPASSLSVAASTETVSAGQSAAGLVVSARAQVAAAGVACSVGQAAVKVACQTRVVVEATGAASVVNCSLTRARVSVQGFADIRSWPVLVPALPCLDVVAHFDATTELVSAGAGDDYVQKSLRRRRELEDIALIQGGPDALLLV